MTATYQRMMYFGLIDEGRWAVGCGMSIDWDRVVLPRKQSHDGVVPGNSSAANAYAPIAGARPRSGADARGKRPLHGRRVMMRGRIPLVLGVVVWTAVALGSSVTLADDEATIVNGLLADLKGVDFERAATAAQRLAQYPRQRARIVPALTLPRSRPATGHDAAATCVTPLRERSWS
jgi:hypothetical protein